MIAIRQARLPDDRQAIFGFIDGLQRYEAEFEKDRWIGPTYAEQQFAALLKKIEGGTIFVAEQDDSTLVGWAVVHRDEAPVYVKKDERHIAVICELYVDEAMRGQGVGRTLISACEDWARDHKLASIHIGHLAENALAERSYDKAGYTPYVVLRRKKLR